MNIFWDRHQLLRLNDRQALSGTWQECLVGYH